MSTLKLLVIKKCKSSSMEDWTMMRPPDVGRLSTCRRCPLGCLVHGCAVLIRSVSLQCGEIGGIMPRPHSPPGPGLKTIGRASRKVLHFYVGPALACSSLSSLKFSPVVGTRLTRHITCIPISLTLFVRFISLQLPKQHVFFSAYHFPFRHFVGRETQIISQQ